MLVMVVLVAETNICMQVRNRELYLSQETFNISKLKISSNYLYLKVNFLVTKNLL